MPILRYAKALLVSPGAGRIFICFLGLLLAGVAVVSERIESRNKATLQSIQSKAPAVLGLEDAGASIKEEPIPGGSLRRGAVGLEGGQTQRGRTEGERSKLHLDRAVFQRPLASDQLAFLSQYAGQPAIDAALKRKLRGVIDMAAPYTPFHYGVDVPLAQAAESVLFGQPLSLGIREERYVMISNQDRLGTSGRRRGFLWIDVRQGIVLGGIFFYPSNGEPTPTLTIFSRQVKKGSLGMSQLPKAFAWDVSQWAAATGIPPIATRYFINASGKKIVLAHDESYCSHAGGETVPGEGSCAQMNAKAAAIDEEAARFLKQTHHVSNATMRMIAETDKVE